MVSQCKEHFLRYTRTRSLNPKRSLKLSFYVTENGSICQYGNYSFEEKGVQNLFLDQSKPGH